jgi:uncharacterized membrane protein YfcA
LCFAVAGPVRWPETMVMLIAAAIGGYVGAVIARRVPGPWLRGFVVVFSATVTAVFFWRIWA